MLIKDVVCGSTVINESVLVDLMRAPTVTRLRGVTQFGMPSRYYPLSGYSRYEHSIGVMLLIRRFGGGLTQQVAGLLHDVSHLAFSHVADWVFATGATGQEDLQDQLLVRFVRESELATILTSYGLDLDEVLDLTKHSLLEQELPDLCADRVDYALREFYYWLNPSLVAETLAGLNNHNGSFVFADQIAAQTFADNFLRLQQEHWGAAEPVIRYHTFSQILRRALEQGVIKKEDFYRDDAFVLTKIENWADPSVKQALALLARPQLPPLAREGNKVYKKFRYVDPLVMRNNETIRLSLLNNDFAQRLVVARQQNEQGIAVDFKIVT